MDDDRDVRRAAVRRLEVLGFWREANTVRVASRVMRVDEAAALRSLARAWGIALPALTRCAGGYRWEVTR